MNKIDHEPMTRDRFAEFETAVASGIMLSPADLAELIAETKRAREDSDAQYSEADYWRESYRLLKGLSNDEIGAIIAVRDASKAHPRPCDFPHETCICDGPS